jgi:long-chain acyl-CoA synthetase
VSAPYTLTLPQALRHQARHAPDRVAIRQKRFGIWKPLTWARYHERAMDVGLGLASLGLPRGGHVGVLSENRIEWVLSQLGAGMVGAVTVGVYPTSPTNEVAYVLGHSDAQVVICEDQEQADKVLDARDQLPAVRAVVVMETKGLSDVKARAPGMVLGFHELEERGRASTDRARVDEVLASQSLDDTGLVIYTSGSTG